MPIPPAKPTSKSLNEVNEENIAARSRLAFDKIKEIDIGNILDEELERSRNTLLVITLASITFNLVDVTEFEFLGIKATIGQPERFIMTLFLLGVSAISAYYYHLNAITDLLSKSAKIYILYATMSDDLRYFDHARKTLKKEKEQVEPNDEKTRQRRDEKIHSMEEVVEKSVQNLKEIMSTFAAHEKTVRAMHYWIIASCVSLQITSYIVRVKDRLDPPSPPFSPTDLNSLMDLAYMPKPPL
jgi:hypothetical protein